MRGIYGKTDPVNWRRLTVFHFLGPLGGKAGSALGWWGVVRLPEREMATLAIDAYAGAGL